MFNQPPLILNLRGRKLIGRVAFAFLLLSSITFGTAAGLLFVYASDLPEIRALEDYRPDVVTELYADDGQLVGSFALQRRILITYDQVPQVLKDAILVTEDQHFEEHWGIDFPRVAQAAWRNIVQRRKAEGASTLTMQLARVLFLSPDKSFRRKVQETLLAIQIERRYTKQQIFTMYCNQIYLAHGNYGFEAASQFYFGKPASQLKLAEAALLAALIRGPIYSPVLHHQRALARRNLVIERMNHDGRISVREAQEAMKQPLDLNLQYPRNDLAPYFFEEIRKYLESTYGTEAVHERGLRVYTTLNTPMQRTANRAVREGLHAHTRRHGWRGNLENILRDARGKLDTYEDDDWRRLIEKGSYVTGLVTAVDDKTATVKIGPYRAVLTAPDFAWTGPGSPAQLLKVGDLAECHIREITGDTARVELDQKPAAQAALVAIENTTGEIKAMVGGYSFEESKFNRATQALRQVGSSFKPYVYTTAIEKGMTPLDTVLDDGEIRLLEHTSAFTVFPNDGIRIESHYIRRVTSYDGALLEEARPVVHDVIAPQVARTMVAMLEEVVQFGTAMRAKELGRPIAGKTGTTNDFTDAWFIGFSPSLAAGVWVGFDDKQESLGKKETGAKAALPIWIDFMRAAFEGKPAEDFPSVEPLAKQALTREVKVDTPDTAPTEEIPEGAPRKAPAPPKPPPPSPAPQKTVSGTPASP